jgi:cytochrome c553
MLTKRLLWKELLTVSLLAVLALGSASARADGDYDAGARKSFFCAYCHGYDGNPLDQGVPRLAGRPPDYLINRIKELQATGTMHEAMRKAFLTGELSDQDVANLATFYSRQPVRP